jgi:hypothetical protein
MSMSRAQAQAIADGFLATQGEGKGNAAAGKFLIIEEMVAYAARDFIENARNNLERSKSVSSGELRDSLDFNISILGTTVTLTVGYDRSSPAAKYFDFVNKGVKGYTGAGAPGSPYQFKNGRVSVGMMKNILKWLKLNGRQSVNIKKPASGLERKRKKIGDLVRNVDSREQLAWATSAAIKRDGTKATRFFDKAITQTFNKDFKEAMKVALAGEVRLQIRRIYNP